MNEDSRPGDGSMALALVKVAAITLLLMSTFQFVKTYFYPDITLMETHITTIAFTTFLAVFAGYFVFRGQQRLLRAMAAEMRERRRAEEALQHYADELNRLHRQLEASHREANLYLDILTHDIRNTENVSNLYADLLIDSLREKGEDAGCAEKLQRSIRKSIEILGTVSTIRRIHQAPSGLKPVDVDIVIRKESEQYPDTRIEYHGSPRQVLADDLLPEVFTNLIGNAVKYGGPDVAITIRTEGKSDEVLISVEDTGPGIPDEDKQAIFHRYEQKKRGVGEGLGLYLVQILVERYGGKVWAEDRVAGHPEGGAAFRFTLKKAT